MGRRRGGPPAHRPSGRGPGCGFAPDRAIPPPSQAGVDFGLCLGSPVWFCCSLVVVVVLHKKNLPTPCLWQAPASTQKTKRKTRPAIRRSARWRAKFCCSLGQREIKLRRHQGPTSGGVAFWGVLFFAPALSKGESPPHPWNKESAPSTVRPLARDLRVLIGWPFPLGFGLDGRLLLARRGRVYV